MCGREEEGGGGVRRGRRKRWGRGMEREVEWEEAEREGGVSEVAAYCWVQPGYKARSGGRGGKMEVEEVG